MLSFGMASGGQLTTHHLRIATACEERVTWQYRTISHLLSRSLSMAAMKSRAGCAVGVLVRFRGSRSRGRHVGESNGASKSLGGWHVAPDTSSHFLQLSNVKCIDCYLSRHRRCFQLPNQLPFVSPRTCSVRRRPAAEDPSPTQLYYHMKSFTIATFEFDNFRLSS